MWKEGFLGTAAPFIADLILLLEIAMGIALILGAWLARRKRFRQHAWCQSAVVILNLPVIALVMMPSFHARVLPKIPAKLGKAYYSLAAAHGILGIAAEIVALFILLSAGTSLLPEKVRITGYKAWMRSTLVLWWVVLILGMVTYVRWYAPHFFRT
jgi:uncharacterized membrane protein YozB (DUF420 family)